MAFGLKQKTNIRSWTDILVEESENSLRARNARRKLTFRRMYNTVFVLFGATFFMYCSLFYIGSFLDAGKVIGISQSERAINAQTNISNMPATKRRTLVSPFFDLFKLNRIFLQKGQTILATYSLPQGTELTIYIRQCKSMRVVEVFKCNFVGEQKTVVRKQTSGFIKFTVAEGGFYYFDVEGVKLPKAELKQYVDYRVVWQRGG